MVEVAANARNCDVPVKTRTGWGNKAKGTAADTGTPAKDPLDVMCAGNCGRPASTRISWVSKAKEIAVGIARLAEVVNLHREPTEGLAADNIAVGESGTPFGMSA